MELIFSMFLLSILALGASESHAPSTQWRMQGGGPRRPAPLDRPKKKYRRKSSPPFEVGPGSATASTSVRSACCDSVFCRKPLL